MWLSYVLNPYNLCVYPTQICGSHSRWTCCMRVEKGPHFFIALPRMSFCLVWSNYFGSWNFSCFAEKPFDVSIIDFWVILSGFNSFLGQNFICFFSMINSKRTIIEFSTYIFSMLSADAKEYMEQWLSSLNNFWSHYTVGLRIIRTIFSFFIRLELERPVRSASMATFCVGTDISCAQECMNRFWSSADNVWTCMLWFSDYSV